MKTHPRRRPSHPNAYLMMEMVVVVFITGIFIVATAPIMQEMFRAFGAINTRQAQASSQDTWTNKLRADLLAGHPVTIKNITAPKAASGEAAGNTSGVGDSSGGAPSQITIPAGIPGRAPILWVIDTPNSITRTTAPDPTGDTTKTFRHLTKSITLQKQPASITIAIAQPDISQPALFTLPLHPGAK